MNLQRIYAATDFSPGARRAVDRAARVAQSCNGELVLIHALERGGWLDQLGALNGLARAEMERVAVNALEAELARLQGIGPSVSAELLMNPLHRELDRLLATRPAQLLVMGVHGAGGWQDALLGSTADRVLRQHRLPVLMVRTEPQAPYARIALATDFSDASAEAARFGLAAFPQATAILLHALEPEFSNSLAFANVAEDVREAYRAEARQDAHADLDAFARRVGGEHAVPAMRSGSPAVVLPALVEEARIDLVVLGVSGRSRIEEGLLGSVSRHAVASLSCDVLLVPSRPA